MRSLFSRLRAEALVAVVLIGLPLALFFPVTLGDRTLIPGDNLALFEPWQSAAPALGITLPPHNDLLSDLVLENYLWKKFIRESLAAGELPLWNPYLFSGVPFLAAGQHSALYPFSVVYYLLPLARAYGWFTVSQLALAGLAMYGFLRVLGLRRFPALFGGILYQLCGFMVVSVVFQMIIAAAVWLPVVLTAVELIARQQPALGGRPATVPWLALGATAIGLQVLAGHVEITYYTLLVAGALAAWRLGGLWLAGRGQPLRDRAASLLRRAGALLAMVALGLGLAAVQFVPLYELASTSFRTGRASFEQILAWAFPLRHLALFFIPNFYGNPSHHGYWDLFGAGWQAAPLNNGTVFWGIKNYVEGGTYLGLLPLLLAPLAVWHWARRTPGLPASFRTTAPFFIGLAALSLAFAFGTPLYALIFWLPGINQLHSPFRWVWPLALSTAVLAAYALTALGAAPPPRPPRARAARLDPQTARAHWWAPFTLGAPLTAAGLVGGGAVWAGALTALALAGAWWRFDALAPWLDQQVRELALASQAFSDGRMLFSYTAPWVAVFAITLIAAGLVLRLSLTTWTVRGRPVWKLAAVAVLAGDLLAAGWGFSPAADPAWLTYVPPSARFLQQDAGLWRLTSFDPTGQKPYNANVGWFFNFQDVRGYDSLFSRQYADYMRLIQPQYELDFNRIAPLSEAEALNSPLLDVLNVKYVISLVAIDNPKYTLVYADEVRIYRNESALPRAYVLPQTATLAVDDFAQAVQQFDPRQYVMVAPADALGIAFALPATPQPAPIPSYTPNEVFVEATVAEPSWLVLGDAYDAGWKAFLRPRGGAEAEEREAPVVRANGNFRAVAVPAGDWLVRFKYTPVSVRLGGILSLLAGVTLLFLVGVWLWRYFYQESRIDSPARRIAKNALAPLALNLLNRAIDLAFAAFMLRVLGPEDAGKYYYAIVIFGWFEIITNYGLNTFLTREVSRDRTHANRYLVNTTVLRLALGLVAIPALALILGLFTVWPSLPLPGAAQIEPLSLDIVWAIGLLVVAQAPATVSTGLSALFYAYEKAEFPAAVATVTTLVKVSLGTIALLAGWGFVGLAGTSLVVNTATLGLLGLLAGRMFFWPRWEADWRLQASALRESFPLMLNNLLATLFFKVDVTLLRPIRGSIEVGWYSTGYKFIDAYNIVPSLFTFALFPALSRQAGRDDQQAALRYTYSFAVKLLTVIVLPVAVLTTFLSELMIGVLGGAEYLPQGAIALVVLAWSMPFGWINSVTNYVLIALGEQRALMRAFAVALVFNVVLNLLFLPRYGFVAAAAITIASEIFEGLAFYLAVRRNLGGLPWLRLLGRPWASAGAMALVTAALWGVSPWLALPAGLAVYGAGLAVLGAFNAEERATLISILPSGLRQRLSKPAAA